MRGAGRPEEGNGGCLWSNSSRLRWRPSTISCQSRWVCSAVLPSPGAHIVLPSLVALAHLSPPASLMTGPVCGVKVQEVDDPFVPKIHYLAKLVDERAEQ